MKQLPKFKNEPLSDFKGNTQQRQAMQVAVEEVRQELGREYDLVIGGERVKTQDKLYSYNPSQ
jgi:1-pyrroline-5-carboxylate dehydrogenase